MRFRSTRQEGTCIYIEMHLSGTRVGWDSMLNAINDVFSIKKGVKSSLGLYF